MGHGASHSSHLSTAMWAGSCTCENPETRVSVPVIQATQAHLTQRLNMFCPMGKEMNTLLHGRFPYPSSCKQSSTFKQLVIPRRLSRGTTTLAIARHLARWHSSIIKSGLTIHSSRPPGLCLAHPTAAGRRRLNSSVRRLVTNSNR
jgi:hypothetical protein